MSYYQKAKDLFKMIEEGKLLESLDKYYHKNVIVTSPDGTTRKGIEEEKRYSKNLLKEIEEIFGAGIRAIASDEKRGITIVEYWIDLKFKDGQKRKIQEVAVQLWEKELIIKESFYIKAEN